jgi:hypothetical protein
MIRCPDRLRLSPVNTVPGSDCFAGQDCCVNPVRSSLHYQQKYLNKNYFQQHAERVGLGIA